MNGLAGDFFVCGFGDPSTGIGGLAWDFGEPGAVLLDDGEARPATFALEEGGDALALQLTGGEVTLGATLSPRTAELALEDGAGLIAVVCVAEAGRKGDSEAVHCPGQISRWGPSPVAGAGTLRHLAIDAGDQSL